MFKVFISILLVMVMSLMASEPNNEKISEKKSPIKKEQKKEIKWAKDFKSGITQARKEHKPVFFVYSRHSCKYCVILEETTFADKMVIENLNKNFVSIIAYSDEHDAMPRELFRPGTPTLWFLMPDGRPMYQQDRNFPIMGAVNKEYFMKLLEIVKKDFKKRNSKKRVKK